LSTLEDNPQFDSTSVYQKAGSAMPEDTPVLDTLAEITAASIAHGSLEAREHMLTRLAALVAVDAPAMSYLVNVGTAADVGVTVEDVQGVLIAVAPIVGTPRVVSAAGNITEALDFVIDVAVAEIEAEAEAEAELASEEA
jgi:alkylhydroperoxidase/carboxymuconolactone decarboxylase family protein YurZ